MGDSRCRLSLDVLQRVSVFFRPLTRDIGPDWPGPSDELSIGTQPPSSLVRRTIAAMTELVLIFEAEQGLGGRCTSEGKAADRDPAVVLQRTLPARPTSHPDVVITSLSSTPRAPSLETRPTLPSRSG